MARFFYRLGQFWQGLHATVSAEELGEAALVLPQAALPLLRQMPVDAQRHSLNVLHQLWSGGHHQADLAVAALLHDCGKVAAANAGTPLGLWLRGPLVIFAATFPHLVDRWTPGMPATEGLLDGASASVPSSGACSRTCSEAAGLLWPAQRLRYVLYVHRHHPAIGAALAAHAGCSPLSCWLIAHHQVDGAAAQSRDASADEAWRLLALLQQADNDN